MKKRHQLRLVGITYNQIESGVYAVILQEAKGERRIPIVIGYPEAQSIECVMQRVSPPRPLSHDLMVELMERSGIKLACIEIHRLENGVFAADMLFDGPDGDFMKIDARSSDAIAVAIRTGAPIYTSSELLEECGIMPRRDKKDLEATPRLPVGANKAEEMLFKVATGSDAGSASDSFDTLEEFIAAGDADSMDTDAEIMEFLSNYTDAEIEAQISRYAADEKYELAARLKRVLGRRKEQ